MQKLFRRLEKSSATLRLPPRIAILLVCGMTLLAAPAAPNAGIPPSERQALLDLYDATGGAGWTNSTNWLGPEGSECEWQGITCDPTQTRVVDISLRGNNLAGALPASLNALSYLWCMDMGSNGLEGTLPATYGDFARLHCMILDNNRIGGEIPVALGQLTELRSLLLERNLLTGTIPGELGAMPNLMNLVLSNNQLSGEIPPELGSLTSIEVLFLSSNGLTGPIPASFASLVALRELGLENNALTGPVPDFLGNLTALEELWLSNNEFSGTVPATLGNLANLRERWLEGNHLEGTLDPALGSMTALQHLSVSRNKFSGPLSPSLTSWPQTLSGDLRFNAFTSESSDLDAFLDQIQPGGDWKATQTCPPGDLRVSEQGENWVTLEWATSGLQGVEGGYEVYASAADGPWTLVRTIWTKAERGARINGLMEDTTYSFKVRAYTNPNVDNANRVESEYTSVVQARTGSSADSGGSGGCFIDTLLPTGMKDERP